MSSYTAPLLVLALILASFAVSTFAANDCAVIALDGFYATTCAIGDDGFPDCQSSNAAFGVINAPLAYAPNLNTGGGVTNPPINYITLSQAVNGNVFIDVHLATDNGNSPSNFSLAYLPNGVIPAVAPGGFNPTAAGYNFINDPATGVARIFVFQPQGDRVELNIPANGNGAFTTSTLIVVNVTDIQMLPNQQSNTCISLYYFNITNPKITSINGDPQFVGLRGQSYQIHGIDGGVYSLITEPAVQVNSRFAFLTGPRACPIIPSTGKKSTACWSHPGSYLSEIGIKTPTTRLQIQSGSASLGFDAIKLNDKQVELGSSTELYTYLSSHELVVQVGIWTMEIENNDGFLNLKSLKVRPTATSPLRAHGLLGQTWNNRRYAGKVKEIEGEVDDYLLGDDYIFGDDFVFNKYEAESQ